MSAQIQVLRRRTKSAQSIKKITRALELIATMRIRKARMRVEGTRPYTEAMTRVLTELASSSGPDHPLLVERKNTHRAAVLVVTSDRGQCGGYNHNVFKTAAELQALLREQGKEPVLYVIGRKGVSYYRFRHRPVAASWTGFSELPSYADAAQAARTLIAVFIAGHDDGVAGTRTSNDDGVQEDLAAVDELHVVYTQFQSLATQAPRARRMAPILLEYAEDGTPREAAEGTAAHGRASQPRFTPLYEFEPDADTLLHALLPTYIGVRLYAALLDSAASESAHRRRAMKAATDNANDMIRSLTLEANRARQFQITEEIIEIVSGAEALRNDDSKD